MAEKGKSMSEFYELFQCSIALFIYAILQGRTDKVSNTKYNKSLNN